MGNFFTCQKCHSVENLQKTVQALEAQLKKQEEEYVEQLEKHLEDFKRKEERLLKDHTLMANWLANAYEAARFNADFEEEEVEEQQPNSKKRRHEDEGTSENNGEAKRLREN